MLEVKNLVKCYSTKGGVTVKALDNVSVKFPETGMVFLLGRSGSGKSTLLNVSGGLDKPDSGEIIVKGRSSKDFSSSDFDSYRNTSIGFIFQEYNILNEFNVEQNIALALQLQGRPYDKKAVNELLEEVDLKGLGKRKPNTLSGGQKQRVAIARALIKSPEIIMADEPTGALDSNTGKQVLDTLKKLSKTKLVIIVSHDREFAEFYGDRIIELKDGQILSDVTKEISKPKEISSNVKVISDDTISIKNTEEITEEDVKNIITVLKKNKGEAIITAGKREMHDVKRVCKIDESGNKEVFNDTKTVTVKDYDGRNTKFIKSRLPASHAFKMGASGLKTKPIRLIFTILLSVIAFTMFGVVATMMSYDPSYSIGMGLENSVYDNIALNKNYVEKSISYEIKEDGEKVLDYEWENEKKTLFGVSELNELNSKGKAYGVNYAGVYTFDNGTDVWNAPTFTIGQSLNSNTSNGYHISNICGFTDCGQDYLLENGFTIVGEYPTNANQVMISKFLAESIKTYGYRTPENEIVTINSISELIGKKIIVQNSFNAKAELVISGIVDTGAIPSDFDVLKPQDGSSSNSKPNSNGGNNGGSVAEQKELEAKQQSFNDYISYSFHSVLYTSGDFYQTHKSKFNVSGSNSNYISGQYCDARLSFYNERFNSNGDPMGSDMGVYGSQFYTPLLLSSSSKTVSFYTFTSSSTIKQEDASNFSITGNDVYVAITHEVFFSIFDNICMLEENGVINLDEQYRTLYESALQKMQNRHSDAYEPFTSEELSLMFKLIDKVEEIDISEGSEYQRYKPLQDFIKNCLKDVVLYDNLMRETKVNFKGFYVVEKGVGYDYMAPFASEELTSQFVSEKQMNYWVTEYVTDYVAPGDAKFNFLLTKSQNTLEQIEFMLDSGSETYSYGMTNLVYQTAKEMTDMVEQLSKIFLIIGAIIGAFAALMLFNFISVSISAKRKEIGILRAVGARGSDVFKIFFAESGVIAFICFVISSIAGFFLCKVVNNSVGATIGISLLNYGLLHVGLILAISFAVSFLATIIPVYFTAKKPPVESIRAL